MALVPKMHFSELRGLLKSVRYPYLNNVSISLFYRQSPERNHLLLWSASKLTGKVDYLKPANQEKALCDAVNVIAAFKCFNEESKLMFIKGTMKKAEQILIWKEVVEVIKYLHRYSLSEPEDYDQSMEDNAKILLGENNNNGDFLEKSSESPQPGLIESEKQDVERFNLDKLSHEAQIISLTTSCEILKELADNLKECNKFFRESSLVGLKNSQLLLDISDGLPPMGDKFTAELEPYCDDLIKLGDRLRIITQSFVDLRKIFLNMG